MNSAEVSIALMYRIVNMVRTRKSVLINTHELRSVGKFTTGKMNRLYSVNYADVNYICVPNELYLCNVHTS